MSAHFYSVLLLSVREVVFLLYIHTHTGKMYHGCAVPPIYMISSFEILGEDILWVASGSDLADKNDF